MKSRITTAAIALALVGAFAAPASAAQAAPAVVTGVVEYKGAPKAGIRVGWFSPSDYRYASVVSGADGSYSLTLPATGEDYVLFSNLEMKALKQSRVSKGYVGVFYGDGDTRDFAFQTLEPYTAGAAGDEVDIELAKPGSLVGVGDALMDQSVYLTTVGGTNPVRSTTGEEERVWFGNLVPGDYRIETSIDTKTDPALDQVFTVNDGEITRFSLDAISSGRVSGVVTGSGKKLEGVLVAAVAAGSNPSGEETRYATTNSQGRYTFNGLRGSDYTLTFAATGEGGPNKGWVPKSTVVAGVNSDTTVQKDVSLAAGGRIRATVANSASSQRNRFTLVRPDGTKIEQDQWQKSGTVDFGGLASGTYTLYFTNPKSVRYGQAKVVVKAGKTTDIGKFTRTKDGITVVGRVYGRGSAGSTRGIRVDASAPGLPSYYDLELNGNGGFRLTGVVAGDYTLDVRAPDREVGTREFTAAPRVATSVGISLGQELGRVHAKLTQGGHTFTFGVLELGGGDDGDDRFLGEIMDGVFHGHGKAGEYDTVTDLWYAGRFQANSPYWVALPEGTLPVTVAPGTTTQLGTLELEVMPAVFPAD